MRRRLNFRNTAAWDMGCLVSETDFLGILVPAVTNLICWCLVFVPAYESYPASEPLFSNIENLDVAPGVLLQWRGTLRLRLPGIRIGYEHCTKSGAIAFSMLICEKKSSCTGVSIMKVSSYYSIWSWAWTPSISYFCGHANLVSQ